MKQSLSLLFTIIQWLSRYSENFKNNVRVTNDVIFGNSIYTLIGLGTAGQVAKATRTMTAAELLINLAETGSLQTSSLNALGALTSTGVSIVTNGLAVAASLETGIVIGSAISAGFQTSIQEGDCGN